jgi:hypothetical protein
MVIEQLNITRLAAFHTEYDTPIGSDGNCPKALAFTLQWVQIKAGQIHLFRRLRLVKNEQMFSMRSRSCGGTLLGSPRSNSRRRPLCRKFRIMLYFNVHSAYRQ